MGTSEPAAQPSVAPGVAGQTAGGSGSGGMTASTGGASESAGGAEESGPAGDGGASSQAGVGSGGDSAVEFPARAVCGSAVNEYAVRYCSDLDLMSVKLVSIEDDGGDGGVSPGEEARAVFSLQNDSSQYFAGGPCVGLLAAIPGLTVLERYNPSPRLYGINPGTAPTVKIRFRVEPDVAPGTRIPLLAWLDVQSALCPNAVELRFELRVAP